MVVPSSRVTVKGLASTFTGSSPVIRCSSSAMAGQRELMMSHVFWTNSQSARFSLPVALVTASMPSGLAQPCPLSIFSKFSALPMFRAMERIILRDTFPMPGMS